MTRDEIIKMAEQAGCGWTMNGTEPLLTGEEQIQRFAALVVSHHVKETRPKPDDSEREWLQQIAYQHGGIGDLCETEFEFGALVAEAEREACAKLCEEMWSETGRDAWANDCAAAIRARGEK
jgi:hypothetical protein